MSLVFVPEICVLFDSRKHTVARDPCICLFGINSIALLESDMSFRNSFKFILDKARRTEIAKRLVFTVNLIGSWKLMGIRLC